jgi:two-component system sensor histidine kinase SenX3
VDDVVEVAVTDRGIGIAPEHQVRVFERFFRVDPARSRATGGTGLGLAIVKHVAANHGGEVKLWSHPGTGSTFTLRLPAHGVDKLPGSGAGSAAANAVPSGVPNGVNNGAQLGAHGASRHLAADLAAGRVPDRDRITEPGGVL